MQLKMLSCICCFFCKYSYSTTTFLKLSSYLTLQWKWLVISNVGFVPGACSVLLLSGQLTGVGSVRWWSLSGARALLAHHTWPCWGRVRWVSCVILTCGFAMLYSVPLVLSREVPGGVNIESRFPPYTLIPVWVGEGKALYTSECFERPSWVLVKPSVCSCVYHM